jgi:hypothetical protein
MEHSNSVEKTIRLRSQQIKSELCAYIDNKITSKVD